MRKDNFFKLIIISCLFMFVSVGTSFAISDPTSLNQYSVTGGVPTLLSANQWTKVNQIKLEATKPAGWPKQIVPFPPIFVNVQTRLQFEVSKREGFLSYSLYNTYDSPFSFIGEPQSLTDTYPDGSYAWRVKAVSSPPDIQESDWVYYPSTLFQADFRIDTTGPTGSILINNDAQYTNNPSAVTLNLSANDAGIGNAGLQRRVWNLWIPWSPPGWQAYPASNTIDSWPLLGGGDGSKTVYIQYRDSLGNQSGSTYSDSIIVDTVPPETIINTGPSGTINTNSTAFNFSGTDTGGSGVTGYLYRLDGSSWTSTALTSVTLNNLSAGNHTFEVKSKDAAGNESSTASRSFSYSPPQIIPPANTTPPKVKKTVATKHHKKVCAKNKKYHAKHCKSVAKNRKKTSANKKFHKKKCTKVIVT